MPRGKKQNGFTNGELRQRASTALFPILQNLGVKAALSEIGAIVLHLGAEPHSYTTPRSLSVVVDVDSSRRGITLDGLCMDIAKRRPDQWKGSGSRMVFTQTKKKRCKVQFFLSGGNFPKILENFTEVVTIAGVPVLPVHAILLHQVLVYSSKRAVSIQMCLDAVGSIRLNELSPLWQSARVLDRVHQYVSETPKSKTQWVALGVEFNTLGVKMSPVNVDEQGVTNIESDDDVSDSDEDEVEPPPPARPSVPRVQEPGPVERVSRSPGPIPFTFGSTGTEIKPRVDSRSAGHTAFPSSSTGDVIRPRVDVHPLPAFVSRKNIIKCDNPVVDLVARDVIALLKELGFECAIFGSAACQLYGNTRIPGDLDVLVLPPASFTEDREWLKQHIVNQRPNQFKLINGKTPGATYRVLYYKLGHEYQVPHPFRGPMHCKVDILVPGVMHLPHLTTIDIIWKGDLPVLPFLTLLLQKLQGWGDHLASPEPHKFKKHVTDARDIQELLSLSPRLTMDVIRPWRERRLMSEEFQAASDDRVRQFCQTFPSTQEAWFKLGFEVD